jgi:hypothetical protein
VSWLREKNDFKRRVRDVLGQFERVAGAARPDFHGARTASPLEHVTRRHLIDHVLIALGWNLDRMSEDMIEEARAQGAATLFLDYLGVNSQTRAPRLIVEAKAWGKPIIGPSSLGAAEQGASVQTSYVGLIGLALQHIKAEKPREQSPVSLEWTDWLTALRDYVAATQRQSGHTVGRVAIASGRWLVIFVDPESAFLNGGDVPAGSVLVFVGDELVERSSEIFEKLARVILVDDIPPIIRPSQLGAYATARHISRVYRALWVTRVRHGPHFNIRPQITLTAALILERDDGTLLTVIDPRLQDSALPYDNSHLADHIAEVGARSDDLIAAVNTEMESNVTLAPVQAFPGFQAPARADGITAAPSVAQRVELLREWSPRPDEFLLVLGVDAHYLRPAPSLGCRFHEWSVCRGGGQAHGASAITARSVDPIAFFFSGEDHHCAHRVVHDRRTERCQIGPFEDFLCCRACSLLTFCWNAEDLAALPCGAAA